MAAPWGHQYDGNNPNAPPLLPSFGDVITRGAVGEWQANAPGRPPYTDHAQSSQASGGSATRLAVTLKKKICAPQQHTTTPTPYDNSSQSVTINLSDKDREDLCTAVTTLYKDEIFPDYQSLKARLQQLSCSPTVLANFLEIYEVLPGFKVLRTFDPPATLFLHDPKWFGNWVDPNSKDDPYPQEMWDAFQHYLESILASAGDTTAVTDWASAPFAFHRGRYGMALELLKRNLKFFEGITLGKMCHIVELAIKKKLLAYENNMLVPAAICVSLTNADHGFPTASTQPPGCTIHDEYIADADELKTAMVRVLLEYPDGFNLSTLKTKMRAIYRKRLSETVFHHTKLLDLVQEPPLSEVCVIEKMDGNCGYFVFPTESMREEIKRDAEENKARRHYHPTTPNRFPGGYQGGFHHYHGRGSSYRNSDRASSGTNRSNPSPSQQRSHFSPQHANNGYATPPSTEFGAQQDEWGNPNRHRREPIQRAPPGFEVASGCNPRTSCHSECQIPMRVERESFNSV